LLPIAAKSGRVVLPRHRVPVAWNVRTDVMAAIPHNADLIATLIDSLEYQAHGV
jgi:hypothetical protein